MYVWVRWILFSEPSPVCPKLDVLGLLYPVRMSAVYILILFF